MKKNMDNITLNSLPQRISSLYETLNDRRRMQLEDINTVKNAIYRPLGHIRDKNFKLPDIYEMAQTLKAHILESLSSHPEGLFDVFPRDLKYSENASKQKTMLVCALENMKMADKLENIVDDLIECGESIVFIGWQKLYRKIRKAAEIEGKIAFVPENKLIYDGPILKSIPPSDFVFDTSVDFEKAAKIYHTKRPLTEVLEDKNNNYLTSEIKAELAACGQKADDNAEKIDILEFWGDIKDEYGNIIENQLVTIAERRYVIRCEANPYMNCPFIYGNIIQNPFTGRGISPLRAAIDLNMAACDILNTQMKAYSLIVNPPYLAPKGAFQGEQSVKPGKIIEYDSTLLPQMPTPLNFSQALCGWDFIRYFKSSIESTTGVFRTMAGELNNQNRTATELEMTTNGQSVRLNMFLDVINRKIIIPIVQKTAETIANFKLGSEYLLSRVSGELKMLEITDDVRFGEYIYRYSDKKASMIRKSRQQELVKLLGQFANVEQLAPKINWEECFKLALSELGVENIQLYLGTRSLDV